MKLCDLGVLDAPVLAFGGPYSNLQALQAVLAEGRARRVGHRICTGDVVAYCANPLDCIDLVRREGVNVVAGNVERQLAAGALDCGCGFDAGSTCDLLSAGWYAYANAKVGPEPRAWMDQLPDIAVFEQVGRRFAVIHGGVSDISRFLWPVSGAAEFMVEIDLLLDIIGRVDAVISGHCGLAFTLDIGGVEWINAGVIGMPPNDGTQQTQFAVIADGKANIHALSYDAPAAAQRMVEAGLTQGYHRALTTGLWPSEDVLPASMRRQSLAMG